MRIILAPAKKMNVDTDNFPVEELPQFLDDAERIKAVLQAMSSKDLQSLWKCGDAIAKLNLERLRDMDLRRRLTPAVMSYEGIAYRYMAPGVMEQGHLDYLREHLRILSGFYGLLRPFDGVVPYRLEMQARLKVGGYQDLYEFWGAKLADALAAETDLVINLASAEYSKAVSAHLPPEVRYVSCTFGELMEDKVMEKGTMCKMARGQMVRWLAERGIVHPEDMKAFDQLGYTYSPERSGENDLVFLKTVKKTA